MERGGRGVGEGERGGGMEGEARWDKQGKEGEGVGVDFVRRIDGRRGS